MDYNVSEVALHQIDQENISFRITTQHDKASLDKSLERLGLLVPPALWPQASGLTIVSGFRRILACQRLGMQRLTVRLLSGDLEPLVCMRMAVVENASQRPLNLIETARAVHLVRNHVSDPRTRAKELTALGLPASHAILDKLKRLVRLNNDLQTAVLDGVLSLPTALATGKMPPPDQKAVWNFFSSFPMSVSKQKEILSTAQDIAGRDHLTIAEVFQSEAMQAIMHDDQYDRNQKTAAIRRHLKMIRYPNLSHAEAQYQAALRSLKLGPDMRIEPPPAFEGDIFQLCLRFKTRRDLEVANRNLGAALANPAIDALFPH